MEQQARRATRPCERGDDSGVPWLAPLLPPQLLGRPYRSPEQQLMAAVLEDAMRELARPVQVWVGSAGRQRAEVQSWFESDDVAWPFSFLNVCEALDLDPVRLRRRVARLGSHGGRVRALR